MTRIVLASASPRRRDLLARLGLEFDVMPADIDESVRAGEAPTEYVRRLSLEKAAAVGGASDDALVIAADTTVDLAGTILGKPADARDARAMLRSLSAATHDVHTGVTVRLGGRTATGVATTSVTFVEISDDVLEWYVATGEPFDKAGAYAIQGAGALLVERVDGSVSNVIGLPLSLLSRLVDELGEFLVVPRARLDGAEELD